jgi:hypothetical protein
MKAHLSKCINKPFQVVHFLLITMTLRFLFSVVGCFFQTKYLIGSIVPTVRRQAKALA